jgi:hypothetical protein
MSEGDSNVLVKYLAPAVALATVLASSGTARADATCIAAYEQTQTLRKDGKPLAAKAQAAICAREACPALLTKDCTKWLAELDVVIPTVVLDPRTPAGGLRTDVRVKVDGVTVSEKLDLKPMALEPGSHSFAFEAEGVTTAERTLLLREGEKNKKVTVTLAPAADAKAGARPVPLGVWIFGGASVIALATSAVFALDGLGKKSDLDSCKPRCTAADVDAMSSSFTYADVALGAGVMAGAAAVYLFLTRPSAEGSTTTASSAAHLRPAPFAVPLTGGGALGVSARF